MDRGGIIMGLVFKIFILIVCLTVVIWYGLDYIVEFGIEIGGSVITGTNVSVASVDLDLSQGKGTVNGLTIRDPERFSDGNVLEVKKVVLNLNVNTLSGNPVMIDRIVVESPKVNFELDKVGKSNIAAIMNDIDRFLNKRLERTASGGEGKRVVIRRFTVRNGELAVKVGSQPGKLRTVRLPSITLTDVGGRNGSAPARIGKAIASTFGRAIVKTASGNGLESYLEIVINDKILNKAKDIMKRVF